MAYHTRCVARGLSAAWLIADLPFGSYPDPATAFRNAAQLMAKGAAMVKLEGAGVINGTGNNLDTPGRMRFESSDFYLKSAAEMAALFSDQPEAIAVAPA